LGAFRLMGSVLAGKFIDNIFVIEFVAEFFG